MCGLPPGRAGRAPQPSRHTRPVAAVTGRGATSGTCCGGGLPVATGLGVAGDPVLDVGAGTDRAAHPAAVTATPATPASRSSRRRVKASPDRSVGDAPMNVTIRRFGREQRNRGENTFALASVAMPVARREIFKDALALAAGTTLAATATAPRGCGRRPAATRLRHPAGATRADQGSRLRRGAGLRIRITARCELRFHILGVDRAPGVQPDRRIGRKRDLTAH